MTAVAYSRQQSYTDLPSVLIQDPARDVAFLLEASDLSRFETNRDTWASMSLNTVTFTFPEVGMLNEVPPFARAVNERPDVLIQWKSAKKSFLISYEDLQTFVVDIGRELGDGYDVSFVIPRGTELIDELPALRRAILQSGEMQTRF